jgi:hypothetical protein
MFMCKCNAEKQNPEGPRHNIVLPIVLWKKVAITPLVKNQKREDYEKQSR